MKAVICLLILSRASCQKAVTRSRAEKKTEPARAERRHSIEGGSTDLSSMYSFTLLRSLTRRKLSDGSSDFGFFLGTRKAGELKGEHEFWIIFCFNMRPIIALTAASFAGL